MNINEKFVEKDSGRRVILVNTWRVVNARGGAEKVFCDMANALDAMGYNVTAICLDLKKGMPGFSLSNGVRFVNAGRWGCPIYCRGLLKTIRAFSFNREVRHKKRKEIDLSWKIKLLGKEIEDVGGADVYISFQPETTYLMSRLQCVNAPIVTMFHFEPNRLFEIMCKDILEVKSALRSSRMITVLLPSYVDQVRKLYSGTEVVAIPNAIPYFENASSLDSKKIVCVGRVAQQKRVELLIEAFAIASNEIPDWCVEYWGETDVEPTYKDKIFQLVGRLGLQDRFCFCGATDNVERVLTSASIFAFPSAFEGYSLALGEAMSKGLPVIGCVDCAGTNEMIENKNNGLLVAPNPQAFAEALVSLAKSRSLRIELGMGARKYIQRCSPEAIWSAWNSLILGLVKEKEN